MADSTDGIGWLNRRWFEYTGVTFDASRGWGWLELAHPEHAERVELKLRSSFTSGEDWEDTFPLRGADGAYRWFISRAVPLRDDNGAVAKWYGTSTDISAQIRTEDELRQTTRRKDALQIGRAHI